MVKYFENIWDSITTILTGMGITWGHMWNIRRDNVTLQYPEERWPRPDRNIGFEEKVYFIEDDVPRHLKLLYSQKAAQFKDRINLIKIFPNSQKFQKVNTAINNWILHIEGILTF